MASKFDDLIRRYAEATIRHRLLTSLVALLVVGGTGLGTAELAFDTRYRIWFEEGSDALVTYDTLLQRFGSDDQAVIAFSDEGGTLLDNPSLLSIRRMTDALWKVEGVKRVDTLANFSIVRASRVDLESPAFGVTSKYVAAAGDRGEVVVWRTDDGTRRTFEGHDGIVEHLLVNAAGDRLFSGGIDRTVRVWDLESGELLHTFRGFVESISALALSPDEKRLYAGSYETLYSVDLEAQGPPTAWTGFDGYVTHVVASPAGLFVASRDVHVVGPDGARTQTFATEAQYVNDLVLAETEESGVLVAATSDGALLAFAVGDGTKTVLKPEAKLGVRSLVALPGGHRVAAGMTDGSVRAYDLDGEPPIVTRIHGDWVVDLTTDANGVVYSASRDRNIARHSPGEGPRISVLTAHRAAARRVLLGPDGRLFSLGDDGDVYVWSGGEAMSVEARLRRTRPRDIGEAAVLEGPPVGRLRALNGFRFPVELRVGGQSRVVHGAHGALLEGLPVPEPKSCDDDSNCGAGQYCDYEQDEPSCVGQTVVEAFRPGTDVRVWAGEAFLDSEKITTIRLPSDEPFSVGPATQSPLDPRTRVAKLVEAYPQPAMKEALEQVLGDYASVADTFVSPKVAGQLDVALGADESVPREGREFLTTLEQAKLSPLRLPTQPFRLAELQYHMMRPPNAPALGSVLDEGTDTTMMIVSLHEPPPEEALTRPFAVRHAIEDLTAQEREATGHAYHVIGGTIMDTWLEDYARRDLEQLGPLFLAVVALLLGVVYRRISGIIVPLGLVGIAVVIATGTAGWLGASLNNMTVAVPHVILASCIGDAVHIFNAYVDRVRAGLTPREATVEAVTANFAPCLWTSASTAIGFFSLSTSPIQPVQAFGWMAGIGVVMAFLLSVTVLPAIMATLPAPKKKASASGGGFDAWIDAKLTTLAAGVNRSTGAIVFLAVFFGGLAIYGITKAEIDTNDLKFFAEEAPFRQGAEFVEHNISGSYALQLMVDLGGQGRIREVEYLRDVDALREHIEETPEVKSVTSIAGTLKTMNRVMSHDLVEDYRLPEDDKRASSYYDAYTFSLPAGLDLTNRVSATEGATVLDVRMSHGPSSWFLEWGDALNAWTKVNLGKVDVRITGKSWLYTNMAKDVAEGFLANVGSAIVLIAIMMLFLARGFRVGVPAMLANTVPIITTVGVLGLLEVALDISILVSCCVALGVVVDDTTHFVAKYRKALSKGASHDSAVEATIREAGKAMVFTTIILVCGFSMLAFTDFAVNRNFGLVVSVMLTMGALFDLTVLPALMKLTYRE